MVTSNHQMNKLKKSGLVLNAVLVASSANAAAYAHGAAVFTPVYSGPAPASGHTTHNNNNAATWAHQPLSTHNLVPHFHSTLLSLQNSASLVQSSMTALGLSTPGALPGTTGLSLNLASPVADVVLGANLFKSAASVTVNVGGVYETFKAGQKVTAAEYFAVREALSGGQTLDLTANGVASGGDFNLSQMMAHTGLLVVPADVTAIDNTASSKTLSISGDIINYGSILALSTNPNSTSATISAKDILNEAGGVISTAVPNNVLSTINGAVADSSLTLNASRDINNAGTIAATHDVNLNAGSGNYTNSGLISSALGNVNLANTAQGVTVNVNAQNGTFQAANGNVNIRSAQYKGADGVNLDGGNYLSNNFNVWSGTGAIAGTVGQVSGVLNTVGDATHFAADSKTLYLGNNTANGDPTYANTGDIVIDGAVYATESLTILAGGNITAASGVDSSISTRPLLLGNGSDITLVAGANVTLANGAQAASTLPGLGITLGSATVDFTAGAGKGGNIDLSGSIHSGALIDAGSSTGNAGNVTLVAEANGATGGQVLLANGGTTSSSYSINTIAPVGNGGNVTIIAGANPAVAGTTVNVAGPIQTSGGGTFTSGNVSIVTANPTSTSGSTVTYLPNGTVQAGSGTITAGTNFAQNAKVMTGDIITAAGGGLATQNGGTGGSITIEAGSGITTGNLTSFGGGGGGASLLGVGIGGTGGAGGAITLEGNGPGSSTGSIGVNGAINSSGGGGGGSLLSTASGGGAGGSVMLTASGPVSVSGTVLTGDGAAGGTDGGSTSTGGGGGGSFGGGGGGSAAEASLLSVNVAAGGGGAGLFGGGGGGVGNGLGINVTVGGSGGGIFTYGLGGVGSLVNGLLGALGLGGNGAAESGTGGAGGTALGLGGLGGSTNGLSGLSGLNVPGITLQATSNQNADITITGNGITLGGAMFGRNVSISAPVGSNGAVNLTNNVTGTNSIILTAHGNGAITDVGGQLLTPNLTLNTDNASIGTSTNPLATSASALTANAGGSASNVYVNSTGPLALTGTNTAGGTYSLTAAGDITSGAGMSLTSGTLNLLTSAGNIGPMTVAAPSLTAVAPGNVTITDTAAGVVSLGASSAGAQSGTFSLEATNASAITTTGDVSANTVTLKADAAGAGINIGGNVTGTNNGTVNLTAPGNIEDAGKNGLVTAANLNVTSTGGDIGELAPFQTAAGTIAASAAGDVYLANTGAVNLLASSAGGGDTFSLVTTPDANGNGSITVSGPISSGTATPIGQIILNSSESGKGTGGIQEGTPGGLLTATTVTLGDGTNGAGSGDLGASTAPLLTDTSNLNANTKGAVYVDNSAQTGNLNLGSLSGSSISVLTGGAMTTTKDITTPGALDLSTDDLTNGYALTGGTVHITGLAGHDLTVTNTGSITATNGDITVDSALDHNVSIGNGGGNNPVGTWNTSGSGDIIVNANGSGPASTNGIYFTGSQDFNTSPSGETVLNASQPLQSINVNDGVLVTSNNAMVANTSNLNLNGSGMLVGNPLILNGGALGGTVTDSSGNLDLSTNMIFNGESLSLLASGSVMATANITINLSGTSANVNGGNGGNLYVLAGYDFTPTSGNQAGPSSTTFTVLGPSATGGTVNLSSATIDVSSHVQNGSGGTVVVVAQGAGSSITLGSINTSANGAGSTSGTGGSVMIIGDGVTVGNINTTGITGGNVTIASTAPVLTGTVAFKDGVMQPGGSIGVASTPVYNGNIVLSGINTGLAAVSVATGGFGSITGTASTSPIIGNSLSLLSGTGGVGNATAPLYTNVHNLSANSSGGVYISDSSSSLTLGSGNSAPTFSVVNTASGTITVTSNIATSNLTLSTPGGVLSLPTSAVTVNPQSSTGSGGTIMLNAGVINFPNSASTPLVLTANAANNGSMQNGGSISVVTNSQATETVGNGAGDFEFIATGTGNGGSASFSNLGGPVVVDVLHGLNLAGGANGNGQSISLTGTTITNAAGGPLALDANGSGTGSGGSLSIDQLSTAPVLVGSGNNANFDLTARGVNGGSVSVATGGALTVDFTGLAYSPTGANGNGGNLSLTAATLASTNTTGPLVLTSNGVGTGNGGSVAVNLTKNQAATVGTLTGDYELTATSGKKGGSGGAVSFTNAGDLTVNPSALNINVLKGNGNGGSITLEAGAGSNGGNLLVTKSLVASGKGTGNGGTINLITNGSNFLLGRNTNNTISGVKGTITVAGKSKGVVNVTNLNGTITDYDSLASITSGSLTALGDGSIVLASTIGNVNSTLVTLTSAGTITNLSAANGAAAKVIDLTAGSQAGDNIGAATRAIALNTQNLTVAAGGLVNLKNNGRLDLLLNASSGNNFTLASGGNVIVGGVVNGGQALNLTSGTSKAITELTQGDVLNATTIKLTSGTLGIGTTNRALEVNTANLVANPGAGAAYINSEAAAVSLNGSNASKLLNLTSQGNLTVSGPVGKTSATVNLSTNGAYNILQGTGAGAVVTGKYVNLSTAAGAIGTPTQAVDVKASYLSTNNATNTGGLVNLDSLSTAATVVNNSFGSSFQLLTSGPTKLNNITTTAGNIAVNETKGLLQTNTGAQLLATNGSITLQESNGVSGTIVLGTNTKIATSGVNGGSVSIFTGTTAQAGSATRPDSITESTSGGGTINYGANGVTMARNASAMITAQGQNVILSTDSERATAITIDNGVSITADPPVSGPALITLGSNTAAGTVSGALSNAIQTTPAPGLSGASLQVAPAAAHQAVISGLNNAGNYDAVSAVNIATQRGITPGLLEEVTWVSDTELATGEIPALVSSDDDLGITSNVSLVTDLEELNKASQGQLAAESNNATTSVESDRPLAASVSVNVNAKTHGKTMHLKRGSVVFAPTLDTLVRTPFGDVSIAAKSLVLILSLKQGTAVYDLHDSHAGAVQIMAAGHKVNLRPGLGAIVAEQNVPSFERINPAQLFGYNNIKSSNLGQDFKLFTSEFSLLQAINTVQPIKQLVVSKQKNAQQIARTLLKTTSILMQINNNDAQYKQVLRPKVVAWNANDKGLMP